MNATRSIRRLGRPACLAVSFFCWVAAAVPPVRAQTVAAEFYLKAAFIYRFPQFVEWPLTALKGRQTLDLCVLSPNPFGDALEELVDGETVNGVPLSVRQVDGGTSLETCPVLFIPAAAPDRRAGAASVDGSLLHAQHHESGTVVPRRIEFERSVRLQLIVRTP